MLSIRPADNSSSDDRKRSAWPYQLGGAVLLYFSFFAVLLVDELVLRQHWIQRHIPERSFDLIRIVYAPLLWVTQCLLGIPRDP